MPTLLRGREPRRGELHINALLSPCVAVRGTRPSKMKSLFSFVQLYDVRLTLLIYNLNNGNTL